MTAHVQRGHARLAPSSSKRFIECPGSIRMSEGIPNTSSVYADEGTAAHELASHLLSLSSQIDAVQYLDTWVNLEGKTVAEKFSPDKFGKRSFFVDAEMADGVQTYVDYCRELSGRDVDWAIEQWLDLSYLGVPGLDGGTGDCVAYDSKTQVLDVVDLKYGRGLAVEPENNTQGLCYALGAIRRYHNRGIKKLRITIVQPRCPHPKGPIRTWEADVIDLLDFESDLKAAALKTISAATDAHGNNCDAEWQAAYLKPGPWCTFCPAAPGCDARRDQAFKIAQAEFSVVGEEITLPVVTQLEPEKLSKILTEIDQLEDWCRRVKEYAHSEATHGRCPPGWKLVGNRATRRWKEETDAATALEDIYGLTDIYTAPKLLTPAKIEPMMPGKNKAERAKRLAELVTKESSGTVLALEADPRPAVKADASEFGEVDA